MITMPVALVVFSASATVVAAIIKFVPKRNGSSNGKYVTTREYDNWKAELGDVLLDIKSQIREMHNYVKSRLP